MRREDVYRRIKWEYDEAIRSFNELYQLRKASTYCVEVSPEWMQKENSDDILINLEKKYGVNIRG